MPLRAGRLSSNPRLQQAAENNPPLKVPERGEAVAIVQQALVDLGFVMPITTSGGRRLPDGIFGQETDRVVRQFQTLHRLAVDGIVGRNTLATLDELLMAKAAIQEAQASVFVRQDYTLRTNKPAV